MEKTILLAEPNKVQQLTYGRILRKAGYAVLIAEDGEEAVKIARKSLPDSVLLEMLLPKLRGRDVMQILKNDPATTHIPLLAFSSLPQANEERVKKDGAAGYFEKSRLAQNPAVGEKDLIELIEKIVRESIQTREAMAKKSPRGSGAAAGSAANRG